MAVLSHDEISPHLGRADLGVGLRLSAARRRGSGTFFSGSGGTGSLVPGNGCVPGVDCVGATCPVAYGGGGGAVGRMHIVTKDGTYITNGNPVFSVQIATASLTPL
jgi:hypothetical protein